MTFSTRGTVALRWNAASTRSGFSHFSRRPARAGATAQSDPGQTFVFSRSLSDCEGKTDIRADLIAQKWTSRLRLRLARPVSRCGRHLASLGCQQRSERNSSLDFPSGMSWAFSTSALATRRASRRARFRVSLGTLPSIFRPWTNSPRVTDRLLYSEPADESPSSTSGTAETPVPPRPAALARCARRRAIAIGTAGLCRTPVRGPGERAGQTP